MTLQRFVIESGYRMTGIHYPVFWPGIYEGSKIQPLQDCYAALMSAYSSRYIADEIKKRGITRVVVLHYLIARPVRKALTHLGIRLPVTVVVTDPYSSHPMWFSKHRFETIVFSERAKRVAVTTCGLPEHKVSILPPLLDRRFEHRPAPGECVELKRSFGFDPERPLVLIAAGGDGLPRGDKFTRSIIEHITDADIAVVCGRDTGFYRKALRLTTKSTSATVRVYGFVHFMYELIGASDVVVTKAGPGLIMESLLLRKPLVLSSYVYGQERGNLDFVVRNGLGFYSTSPTEVTDIVGRILEDDGIKEKLILNIERIGMRNGTDEIIDHLLSGIRKHRQIAISVSAG